MNSEESLRLRMRIAPDDDVVGVLLELDRLRTEVAVLRRMLACERLDASAAPPGWMRDPEGFATRLGALVRLEGLRDENGGLLWCWYIDACDDGDPSQVAPTAYEAMEAADAARGQSSSASTPGPRAGS